MGRYTENDIVYGKRVTSNGMLAGYVNIPGKEKAQFRFIRQVKDEKRDSHRNSHRNSPKKRQTGGDSLKRPVSLKTAVQLLRQYYQEKYN